MRRFHMDPARRSRPSSTSARSAWCRSTTTRSSNSTDEPGDALKGLTAAEKKWDLGKREVAAVAIGERRIFLKKGEGPSAAPEKAKALVHARGAEQAGARRPRRSPRRSPPSRRPTSRTTSDSTERPLLSEGQTFAHYVIEAPIGEGGMGAVYRAHRHEARRKVALKVIHPDLAVPDAAARLVREARTAAAFSHPNTVAIHDLGEIDGTVFLVMELVSGAPLRAYVGDTSVPVSQKLRWLVDMARGLGAAHKAGLVHRDVKPTNVMVSDDGVVKVLDFGLAKPLEAASFHTGVGLVVGTPRYMAPELFTGMRADARSDQYAFGVTAYELLAGVYPGTRTGRCPPRSIRSFPRSLRRSRASSRGRSLARPMRASRR